MSSIERFIDKAQEELKVRPILPFGAPIRVGSVGVVEDDHYSPRGTVEDILGIAVGDTVTSKPANWHLTSGKDVQLDFLAEGQASTAFPNAPKANVRIDVSFGSSESFLADVANLTITNMVNPAAHLQAMLEAYDRGTWRSNYVFIYQVVVPEQTLVLLSKHSNSKFLLSAKAGVTAPQGTVDLAGKVGLSFQNQDAISLDSAAQPLYFNAFRVHEDFFTGALSPRPLGADDTAGGVLVHV